MCLQVSHNGNRMSHPNNFILNVVSIILLKPSEYTPIHEALFDFILKYKIDIKKADTDIDTDTESESLKKKDLDD